MSLDEISRGVSLSQKEERSMDGALGHFRSVPVLSPSPRGGPLFSWVQDLRLGEGKESAEQRQNWMSVPLGFCFLLSLSLLCICKSESLFIYLFVFF